MTITRTSRRYHHGSKQCRTFGYKIYTPKRIKEETLARINFFRCRKFPVTIVYECSSLESFIGRTRRQALLQFNRKYPGYDYYLLTGECRIEKAGIRILIVINENNYSPYYSVYLPYIDLSRYNKIKVSKEKEYVETDFCNDEPHNFSSYSLKHNYTSGRFNIYSKVAGFILLASITIALAKPPKSGLENKINHVSEIRSNPDLKSRNLETTLNFQEVYRTNPGDTNKFIYMVKNNLYPFLASPLETLAMLTHTQQGNTVVIYTCNDALAPDSSRNFLKNQYLADTLNGLKLAWMIGMRTNKEFQARSAGQLVQGPSDHYFRALASIPIDTLIWNSSINNFVPGSDSVIDGWGGDKTAKIGFGRIGGGDLTINVPPESILLKNYIQRDIQHRRAVSQESTWGLFFAEPATGDTGYCRQAMQPFFPVYVDTNLNVPGFIQFLQRSDLKGVSIGTHGSSLGFVINGEQVVGSQMVDINPKPDIQVINSCNGCKFSDPNNVGNYMNLTPTHGGLNVIGYSGIAPTPLTLTESAFWPTIDSGTTSQAVNAQVNYYANRPWAYNASRDFFLLLGDPAFISRQFPHGIEEQVYEVKKPSKLYSVQPSIITNGKLLVKATTPGDALVNIYASNGQLYKKAKLTFDEKTETFNVSDLPNGIYFVKFDQKDKSETKKITITR